MCCVTNNVQEIIFSYMSSKIARFCLVSQEFPLEWKNGRENITKSGEHEQCGWNRAHVKIVGGVPGTFQWMNHEYFECQSRLRGNLEFGFESEPWYVMISLGPLHHIHGHHPNQYLVTFSWEEIQITQN